MIGRIILAVVVCLGLCASASAQQETTACAFNVTHTGAACEVTPQASASALESSHVFKTSPGILIDFQVNNASGSTIWVMVFDATAAPTGSGAAVVGCASSATARPCVAKWYQLAANSTLTQTWAPGPFLSLQAGEVIACSSTGPFTLTYSVECTFSAETM